MQYFIRQFLGLVLFFSFSLTVNSISLSDAFKMLTSTTQPGVYNAQIRGYMTAGGGHIHFPSYAVDLASLSPPYYSAGCSGMTFTLEESLIFQVNILWLY